MIRTLVSLCAIALVFVSSTCAAQWVTKEGIRSRDLRETTVPSGEAAHSWATWLRLFNYGTGDNVTQYLQHYNFGAGPAFGQVVEVQHHGGVGNAWGIEVDLMTPPKMAGSYYRIGVGVVLGPPALNPAVESHASHGFVVMPFAGMRARVDYGLQIAVPCDVACVDIPAGERIRLSNDPAVGAIRFDPRTGILGMWRADGFLVWGVQQETGQQFSMRRFD